MPPTLGQRLKHAREKRGLSLRDVEHTTRIPVPRLQDLEDDKLNTFGGMTYAKCFLRTYATLLDVNAEEVLSQMQPPPLGGMRDYRYLVESQGLWVADLSERPAMPLAMAPLNAGRPLMLAMAISLAFAVLIGGGVLANAYFHSKPEMATSTATPVPDHEGVRPKMLAAVETVDSASLSRGAYLSPDQLGQEPEFSLFGVSLIVAPDRTGTASPPSKAVLVPPKAQAVVEPPHSKTIVPPKAEAVR